MAALILRSIASADLGAMPLERLMGVLLGVAAIMYLSSSWSTLGPLARLPGPSVCGFVRTAEFESGRS